jgi:hypothetical protein
MNTKLPHFMAYALHHTKLHSSVTFAALILLQQLKAHFPMACGSLGHRLFMSAFTIVSKVLCDNIYLNKSFKCHYPDLHLLAYHIDVLIQTLDPTHYHDAEELKR